MGLQIEAGIDHCAQGLRILFTGQSHQVDRGLEAAVIEGLQQAPVADARTVLVTRFDVEVAVTDAGIDFHVGYAHFGAVVAIQNAQLATFFV